MLRDTIRSILGRPTRLDTTRKHISLATLRLPHKIGTWTCICSHTNSIYHLSGHLHPLGMMVCAREDCGLTWHPSTNPITPHQRSELVIQIHLPDPNKRNDRYAPYILPFPQHSVLQHIEDSTCPGGYGYVCLNEKCGLSWATKVVKEWPWGRGRKVLAVAGRRWKGSCLCGRRVQIGGGFAVVEILDDRIVEWPM